MKLKTPEQLSTLTNARLIRRHDAVRRVWQTTASENTARRCACRMSVIQSAARIQDADGTGVTLYLYPAS